MTAITQQGKDGLRILITLASAIVVVAGLQAGRDILMPIVLASFLAVVSYPITKLLRDVCHFPHWLSVMLTVFVDFGVLIGLGFLFNYLAGDFNATVLSKYNVLLQQKYGDLIAFLKINNWDGQAQRAMEVFPQLLNGQHVMDLMTSIMGKAASILSVTILILILMTFFLGEAPLFKRNVNKIATANEGSVHQFTKAIIDIQKYLVIKTFISFLTAIFAWILCFAVGVDLPLFWAILAFFLNYIPTFGSIVAALPPILLSMLMLGTSETVILAIGYVVMNITLGNFVEPMMLGKQFGIATCVVLLSVVFWGWLWGPIGMFLAVPISMLIKLALESSKDLGWIAQLIDNPLTKPRLPSLLPSKDSPTDNNDC
ncbi:MAG: AI-2E family transporter [Akkermansia sp.]